MRVCASEGSKRLERLSARGGRGTKLTVREAHGEDERRGKEDRKGSQTPDDPKGSADSTL